MPQYILDTNAYDYLFDYSVDLDELKSKGEFFTTNIQKSEILNIKDSTRRKNILDVYNDLDPIKLKLQTGVWLDDLHWEDGENWDDSVSQTSSDIRGNSKNLKSWKDAFIGNIAAKNNYIVVTDDDVFANKLNKIGTKTLTIAQLVKK